MAFAILKLSYTRPGDNTLTGGICGTGFFIDNHTGVTAHHVLNNTTFAPNEGYQRSLLWIISRNGGIYPLKIKDVRLVPEIETTIIMVRKSLSWVKVYELCTEDIEDGLPVYTIGYIGNSMPKIQARWDGSIFRIKSANLATVVWDKQGSVLKTLTMSVNASDVNIYNVKGFEVSFGSRIGMSGGPVIRKDTGQVIGMLSIGLPPDSDVRTETFAVSLEEIKKYVSNL